jgi:hypothetical protein
MILMRALSIYKGHWKGWALKSRLFWAPQLQRAKRVPFGPKKDLFPAHGETEHQRWDYKRSSVGKYNLWITGIQYKKIKLAGLSNSFFSSGSSFHPFLPLGCMQSHVLNWLIVNIQWNKQNKNNNFFSFLIDLPAYAYPLPKLGSITFLNKN